MKQAALKYSIKTNLKSMSPFYLTLIALFIIFMILNLGEGHGSLGSWDLMAMFVSIGLASCFKERFHFFLQNGFSRKTIFQNFLVCFLLMSVLMAAFESFITAISTPLHVSYRPMFNSMYEMRYAAGNHLLLWEGFLWHAFAFLTIMSVSFFFIILYYRSRKEWRIIFFIVVPTVLFLGFPILDFALFDGAFIYQCFTFILQILGLYNQADPFLAMATFTIITLVSLSGAYLLLIRTNIQK